MIESYFGHPTTHEQIDPREDPRLQTWAPPRTTIASYANSHGTLRASVKNEGSLEDLAKKRGTTASPPWC